MSIVTLRSLSRSKTTLYLSFALLAAVTVYCVWYANYYLSGNSDDIVYPYLFSHFQFHDIILPGQHSNILKFPLFILQAILPYNFTTFTIVNMGLVLTTTLAWAAMLVWLFGKRYAPIICLSFVSVLLGSQLLNYDLVGTTIRNIEYPIVLGFVIYSGLLLRKQKMSNRKLVVGGILGLLYALTLAGDSFFFYTIFVSLFAVTAFLWFIADKKTGQQKLLVTVMAYICGFSALALVIRLAVKVLGIARYYTAGVFLPHVLPLNHLAPSISTATTQLLNLFDANIFGQKASLSNNLVFLNFLLLVAGLVGLLYILHDVYTAVSRKDLLARVNFARVFTLGVMALSFFVTYVMYIMSDSVVSQTAAGQIVSTNQDRYLAMLPLLLVIGIAYLVWRKFDKRQLIFLGLPLLIMVVLLVNSISIKHGHIYNGALREGEIAVAQAATAHHVPLLITGYWYGASTRFWSHDKVMFTSVAACNQPQPTFNNRLSWYKPSPVIHSSALVVAPNGADSIFWQCTDKQLVNIYGQPTKIIHINVGDKPDLWLYNYDVRSKILPMTY